jgi:putative ABC transport system permease protein
MRASLLVKDLREGARSLIRQPHALAVAALMLAFGLAANTAMFSLASAVLAGKLPYVQPERLAVPVGVNKALGFDQASVTYLDYLDWREQGNLFAAVAIYDQASVDIRGDDVPERVTAALVSADYFGVLRARPVVGRAFVAEEGRKGGPQVVMLSEALWRRRYSSSREIIGQSIDIDGTPRTVVGVMPAAAQWPQEVELWLPLQIGDTPPASFLRPDNFRWSSVARLRQGVTLEQARARLALRALVLAQEYPQRKGWTLNLIPLRESMVGHTFRQVLFVLFAAVAMILLIVCLNLAQILLARNSAREKEMAVRMTLGASRLHLVRQVLAESLLLSLASGAAGLLLAFWGMRALVHIAPDPVAVQLDHVVLDSRILAFTLGLSLLTAILAGVLPALDVSRPSLGSLLREVGEGKASWRGLRLRSWLIASEVALSLVLVAGARLTAGSFERLSAIDPGVRIARLLTFNLSLPRSKYQVGPTVTNFYEELARRLSGMPRVVAVSGTSALPLGGGGSYLTRVFVADHRPEPPVGRDEAAQWSAVGLGYFRAAGIPLLRGRDFASGDTAGSSQVIIVSESLSRRLFGSEDPVGKRIRSWRDENRLREIVGVVRDVRTLNLEDTGGAEVYVPHAQDPRRSMMVVLQTRGEPLDLMTAVRREVRSLEPDVAVAEVRTMEEVLNGELAGQRFLTVLLGAFACMSLLLAVVGLFGLVSYSVRRRNREIGIRIAVGARGSDVLREILWQGLRLALIGIAIGLAATALLTRWLDGVLFEIGTLDPASLAETSALMIGVTLLACYLPARRATRVDPTVVLRQE